MLRAPKTAAWLADPETGCVYVGLVPEGPLVVLNETAALVWELADGAADTEHLMARVVEATGIDRDEIAPHVAATVNSLVTNGLLEG